MQAPKTPDLPQLGLADALAVMEDEKTELDKVLELLLDPRNIHHNTELTQNEITAFSVLASLAKKYNLEALTDFILENLKLRVSKGRQGRKEWVKITSRQLSMMDGQMPDQGHPGFWGRMMGRNRR